MATASAVPETHQLEGEDARTVLKRIGRWRLLKDAFVRLRTADGLSLTRAVAHASVLTALPALIMVIALASAFDWSTFRQVIQSTLEGFSPGPSEQLLRTAFERGSGGSHGVWVSAGIATLLSGTFLMAQIERGLNRIYGMTRDRSIGRKLLIAFLMTLTAGLLLMLAIAILASGPAVAEAVGSAGIGDLVGWLRWPLALVIVFGALTVIYKVSPNRHQPSAGWLQTGTVIAAVSWALLTALLAVYYATSGQMEQTYGPLLGVIALLTWAYATALATFYGMAVAAQLEAVRAGVRGPRTLRRYNETVRDPSETEELENVHPLTADEQRISGAA